MDCNFEFLQGSGVVHILPLKLRICNLGYQLLLSKHHQHGSRRRRMFRPYSMNTLMAGGPTVVNIARLVDFFQLVSSHLKVCTHGAICIRVQILHICKICIRMQIAPCVRIYSRMQNLHVCKSWKICTCLRPSANLILRICKFCIYANLVM